MNSKYKAETPVKLIEDNKKRTVALEAGKYLIQCYMTTPYQCNRQKIQKLIIFTHLALLLDGKEGIIDKNYFVSSTIGLGVHSVSDIFHNLNFNTVNKYEEIALPNFCKKDNTQFTYEYQWDENILSEETRLLLKKFFLRFGAYPSNILVEVTKKLSLWVDYDYLTCSPCYQLNINPIAVNNYISNLQQKNPTGSGYDVIKREIENIIEEILSQKQKTNIDFSC